MSGAHDLFWLARYAYNKVSPLLGEDEKLIIHLQFDCNHIDVWVHAKAGGVRRYQIHTTTWQEVEKFAATFPRLEVGIPA